MDKQLSVCAVLLAAGSSTRMGGDRDGKPINKLLLKIGGADPILRCARRFSKHVDSMVIVASHATLPAVQSVADYLMIPVKIVMGGTRRQDSVFNGISASSADIVAIHDCARCLVTDEVIAGAIESAKLYGSGAPAVKIRDTIRVAQTGEIVPRDGLVQMQTPQCFDRKKLIEAYSKASEATDDAAIWQRSYGPVRLTEGSLINQKLTEIGDISFFNSAAGETNAMRIGIGEDTHRLVEGRKLILGGIEIPYQMGLLGHSDADALVHAIIDAILGASALGDIGRHFPDSDPAYKGISSLILLKKTIELLSENGFVVSNIDSVITAQEPKLAPYIDRMRKNIADTIKCIGIERISIKATTPEHTGPEGNLECITVRAVACVVGL